MPSTSSGGVSASVRWWTAYALSQKIRKSGAAAGIETSARVTVLGVDRAGGVGVRRDDPDALDGRILGDQLPDLVQVGPVRAERDGHHLDPVLLAEREVPVVAGHRAENLIGSCTHGSAESTVPLSRDKTSVSCMIARLALSPATSWSTGTLSSWAKISRISGSPGYRRSCGSRCRRIRVVALARQRQQLVGQIELGRRRLATGQVELQSPRDQGAYAVVCSSCSAASSSGLRSDKDMITSTPCDISTYSKLLADRAGNPP